MKQIAYLAIEKCHNKGTTIRPSNHDNILTSTTMTGWEMTWVNPKSTLFVPPFTVLADMLYSISPSLCVGRVHNFVIDYWLVEWRQWVSSLLMKCCMNKWLELTAQLNWLQTVTPCCCSVVNSDSVGPPGVSGFLPSQSTALTLGWPGYFVLFVSRLFKPCQLA